MVNVLTAVAQTFGLRFQSYDASDDTVVDADVVLYLHAQHFDRSHLRGQPFRGSHLVRDPRDVVVSGYFYHRWTDEHWVHQPVDWFGGQSYKEQLEVLGREEGLMFELEQACQSEIRHMGTWNYAQPEFLELRYEDLVANESEGFERLFRHYGLTERAIARALDIVDDNSFQRQTGRHIGEIAQHEHLRSGKPGEWRDYFSPDHIARFKELAGDVLITLGYENDLNWNAEPASARADD
jgi:hypothetical protein